MVLSATNAARNFREINGSKGVTIMVREEQRDLKVEVIKLAVGATAYRGFSIKEVYKEVVCKLKEYYQQTMKKEYLEAALLHIRAYMEMGYNYDDNKEMFDSILKILNMEWEIVFPKRYFPVREIALTKPQVRRLILRWPASKQRMGIGDVVDDIIKKVKQKEIGIYHYDSNPTPHKLGTSGDLYELVVGNEESYFRDVNRRKYFTFKE